MSGISPAISGQTSGPALLQYRYGGGRFAVGTTSFAVTIEGDWGCGGQGIGRGRRLMGGHGRSGGGLSRHLQCSKEEQRLSALPHGPTNDPRVRDHAVVAQRLWLRRRV